MSSKYTPASGAKIGKFKDQAYEILAKLDAEDTENSNHFILVAMAGDLDVLVNGDWLCCQFRDIERAQKLLKGTRLDRTTGRWDWRGAHSTGELSGRRGANHGSSGKAGLSSSIRQLSKQWDDTLNRKRC